MCFLRLGTLELLGLFRLWCGRLRRGRLRCGRPRGVIRLRLSFLGLRGHGTLLAFGGTGRGLAFLGQTFALRTLMLAGLLLHAA